MVVPQLPEMDLDPKVGAVYAAKPEAAELRRGILNANGRLAPAAKDSLTMRDVTAALAITSPAKRAQFERRFTSRTAPRAALVVSAA